MRKRIIIIISVIISALSGGIYMDHKIARLVGSEFYSDKTLIINMAESAKFKWRAPTLQGCTEMYAYKIYKHQLCFISVSSSFDTSEWRMLMMYHSPLPYSSLLKPSYYYSERSTAKNIGEINYDGTIILFHGDPKIDAYFYY